ncbi:uncharacterized protein LOC107787743 [Nicotiana tabacum]|uniref:Uncharacterized protein LOC107787743 n=1 Tax=Nicotiana tabacum TaxID=4097 RepID=A0AC58UNC5_TOBAC
MMLSTTMLKQPLVTLNTSVFDIPSQSANSYGEFEGEHALSTIGDSKTVTVTTIGQHRQHTTTAADVNTNPGQQRSNANKTGQKQSNANTTGQQQSNANMTGAKVMVTDIPTILLEDRKLLDALGSPKPHKSAYSSYSKMIGLKLNFSVTNRQEPSTPKILKRHEPLWMVIQDEANQKLEDNICVAISEEAKEDDLIESCPEEAATTGDFTSNKTKKKKATQEITLRQLPIRAAKKKGLPPPNLRSPVDTTTNEKL